MRQLTIFSLLFLGACSVDTERPEQTDNPVLPEQEASVPPAKTETVLVSQESQPTDSAEAAVMDSLHINLKIDEFEQLVEAYAEITRGGIIEVVDSISADTIVMRRLSLEEVMIDLQEVGSYLAISGGDMSMDQIVRFGDLQTFLSQEQQLAVY